MGILSHLLPLYYSKKHGIYVKFYISRDLYLIQVAIIYSAVIRLVDSFLLIMRTAPLEYLMRLLLLYIIYLVMINPREAALILINIPEMNLEK